MLCVGLSAPPPRAESPLSTRLTDLIECGLICTLLFPIKAHNCPKRFIFPSRLYTSSPPSYTHPFILSLFFSCLSLPPWQGSILSPSIEGCIRDFWASGAELRRWVSSKGAQSPISSSIANHQCTSAGHIWWKHEQQCSMAPFPCLF